MTATVCSGSGHVRAHLAAGAVGCVCALHAASRRRHSRICSARATWAWGASDVVLQGREPKRLGGARAECLGLNVGVRCDGLAPEARAMYLSISATNTCPIMGFT